MNIFNPFSVLGFENEIEKSKYINKVDSSKIFETNSPNFPKLYSENFITQQNSSANLNLNQAIEKSVFYRGNKVKIHQKTDVWIEVSTFDGRKGWIRAQDVRNLY